MRQFLSKTEDFERTNLRCGLQQIVDLYVDHEERILTKYIDLFERSEYRSFQKGELALDYAKQQAHLTTMEKTVEAVAEIISCFDLVIKRNGTLKLRAEELKREALGLLARKGT